MMMLTSAPEANIPLQLKPCHVIKIIRILKNRDLHFKYLFYYILYLQNTKFEILKS